jgi:outer membrane protein assembly factor BamB
MWGYGSSPILHEGKIILNCGPGKRNFLTAIDAKTGETLWEQDEPFEGTGDRNEDGQYMGSWCTPIVENVDGRDQVICAMPTRIKAHDLLTGELVWTCDGVRGPKGDLAYSSPMISGKNCVYVAGFNGPAMAFKIGGTGSITSTNRLWRNETNPQNIGTGVFIGEHVYRSNASRPSIVDCIHALTGDVVWTGPAGGSSWSSIIAAGDYLYLTDQEGTTMVFKPNPKAFELVARNVLNESTNSTMAISDGEIFIRTFGHLYCIAAE